MFLNLIQSIRGGKVCFIEHNEIGERDLFAGLRRFLKLRSNMLCIDNGHHTVKRELTPDPFVDIQALRHRSRLRESRGFDDDSIEF